MDTLNCLSAQCLTLTVISLPQCTHIHTASGDRRSSRSQHCHISSISMSPKRKAASSKPTTNVRQRRKLAPPSPLTPSPPVSPDSTFSPSSSPSAHSTSSDDEATSSESEPAQIETHAPSPSSASVASSSSSSSARSTPSHASAQSVPLPLCRTPNAELRSKYRRSA